jgi:hypothetical protein
MNTSFLNLIETCILYLLLIAVVLLGIHYVPNVTSVIEERLVTAAEAR